MRASRVTLITGAASGIGRATALKLASPDTGLILHSGSNQTRLEKVADAAKKRGAQVTTVLGDIRQKQTIDYCIKTAQDHFACLDCVIAVAGKARRGSVMTMPNQDLCEAMDEAVFSFINIAKQSQALLSQSKAPRLIAVSSFVAHMAYSQSDEYFAPTAISRLALENTVRLLSYELAKERITVNAVAPGLIEKDDAKHSKLSQSVIEEIRHIIPLKRRGKPEEVAEVIAFLASPNSSYVTGQIWHVNGGLIER